jgi:SAM-dependent methyltransferase
MTRAPTCSPDPKRTIQDYWERKPCGSKHASAPEGDPEYFAQVEKRRYELEPFIATYADFAGSRGKRVLEIGVGLGTDFMRFARAGANVTGVDLTQHSIDLVTRRLALEGLDGEVRVADAEALPFEDNSFDRVYSWGVLMVTPDTPRAVAEALRVLRPGGELCAMVYSRRSWVAFGLWARYALIVGKPWRSLADVVAHHMESPGMKAYTGPEVRALFAGLEDLRLERVGTPYDRRVAGPLARLTGRRLGWFMVVRGHKPTAPRPSVV